jgi:alkylated DNA repair dioxygenase AlkB
VDLVPMRGVEERPAGLVHRQGVASADEERDLLAFFAGVGAEPVVMHGTPSRRRVRHFGVDYDVDTWDVAAGEPIPASLLELRDRAAEVAGAAPADFVEALVTDYPPGATIGWHRDASAFGPVVVGVSLGSDAAMRFQRRAAGGERRVFEQPLERRSAYVLAGAARSTWQHSVPPVRLERWSVTYRQLHRSAG